MSKTVNVTSIIRKLYVEHNGELIEVKQIDNPEDYGKGVNIYTKEAVKGVSKGASIYAVSVEDYTPKKRASVANIKDNMIADMLAGMTPEQIQAKYA